MLSICEILDRLEVAAELPRLQQMIEPTLDRPTRARLHEFLRTNRRKLVDNMLQRMHPATNEPTFASSLFFAGFLDRLCQALQRGEFLPLELWIKALALDSDFESRSSRFLTVACSMIADEFRTGAPEDAEVAAYLTMTAVELEVTFVNARLQRMGTPRIDTSKLIPADHIIDALVAVVRTHSDEEYQHARAVSALCGRVAAAMGMSPEQVLFLERAGLLCGIGKIGIPDAIRYKLDALNADERAIVSRYPAMGASVLRTMPALAMYAPVIRAHRERLDGRGYPDGAGANDIPLQAKIVGVVDAFHAMMSPRPYREALTASQAIEELKKATGSQYDSDVVHTLVRLVAPIAKAQAKPEREIKTSQL
ncbi:MAG: HD-GYP domain-containing protein [Candidatus Baltobacteraceae bacterium]